MSKKEKSILLILGGLITMLIVYVMVRLKTNDAAFSIVPGWHTTIYPPEITWSIFTVIILILFLVGYLILRVIAKLFTLWWAKLKS